MSKVEDTKACSYLVVKCAVIEQCLDQGNVVPVRDLGIPFTDLVCCSDARAYLIGDITTGIRLTVANLQR